MAAASLPVREYDAADGATDNAAPFVAALAFSEGCRASGASALTLLLEEASDACADLLSSAESATGTAARALVEQATSEARRSCNGIDLAAALVILALLCRSEQDLAAAQSGFVEACRLHHGRGNAQGVVECLEGVAGLTSTVDAESALVLFGCAAAVRQELSIPRLERTRRTHADDVAAAFGRLPLAVAFRSVADGASLPLKRAVSIACREAGSMPFARLTTAEAVVASLVAEGLTNAEIGQRLGVSPRTVQAHVSHALAKLGVSTRTALARELNRRRDATERPGSR